MTKAVFLAICLIPGIATAQDFESMEKAQDLGSLLGSEAFCGLTFNQDAVVEWIDANTDPADMGFASALQMMTDGSKFNLEGMSATAKSAHCRAVERTAKHYGFIQ